MALEFAGSKGFVYTLEAVIASALVLGVLLSVMPEFQQDADIKVEKQAQKGLEVLDKTGNLTDNLSSAEIKSELDTYIPDSYNHTVSVTEVKTVSGNISSPYQQNMNGDGNYSELQLWIDSASGLNVSFAGETVVEDYSSSGYKQVSLSQTSGWLNFSGTGELEFEFDTYSSPATSIDAEDVFTTSYIVHKNGTKEVRVNIWQ